MAVSARTTSGRLNLSTENDGLNWPHCAVAVGPSEAVVLTRQRDEAFRQPPVMRACCLAPVADE